MAGELKTSKSLPAMGPKTTARRAANSESSVGATHERKVDPVHVVTAAADKKRHRRGSVFAESQAPRGAFSGLDFLDPRRDVIGEIGCSHCRRDHVCRDPERAELGGKASRQSPEGAFGGHIRRHSRRRLAKQIRGADKDEAAEAPLLHPRDESGSLY